MAQVILITNTPELNDILSLNLSSQLAVEVIPRTSAKEAMDILQLLPSIEVIITDLKMGREDTAFLLKNYIKQQELETELIVLGVDESVKEGHMIPIEVADDWKKIIRTVAKIIGVNENQLEESSLKPDYFPIKLTYFLALNRSCCDAYIRIKKGPGEFQYVKRIHRDDSFDVPQIQKYMAQGLTQFFIPFDQKDQFANDLSNQLVLKLDDALKHPAKDDNELKEQIQLIGQSYDIVVGEIIRLGFNTATIQLTEAVVDGMRLTAVNNPEMSPLLKKVINSQSSFIYQHAHMTAIVAIECLRNIHRFNESDAQKLAFAAFFQNISIIDQESLAHIYTTEQLEALEQEKKLTEEEWDQVFFHARNSAQMIHKFPGIPNDVEDIIRSHHGSPNGKGLTPTKVEDLTDLCQIFIIANNFAHELLDFKLKGGKPKPIIEILKERFPQPILQSFIKGIAQTLKKSK